MACLWDAASFVLNIILDNYGRCTFANIGHWRFTADACRSVESIVSDERNTGVGGTIFPAAFSTAILKCDDNDSSNVETLSNEFDLPRKAERYYAKENPFPLCSSPVRSEPSMVSKAAAFTNFGCGPKDLKIEEAATLNWACARIRLSIIGTLQWTFPREDDIMWCSIDTESGIYYGSRARPLRHCLWEQYNRGPQGRVGRALAPADHLHWRAHYKEAPNKASAAVGGNAKILRGFTWWSNPAGWCRKEHQKRQCKYNLYCDGLKIYTRSTHGMQQYAWQSIWKELQGC